MDTARVSRTSSNSERDSQATTRALAGSPLSNGHISEGVDSLIEGAIKFNLVPPSPEPENTIVKVERRTRVFSHQADKCSSKSSDADGNTISKEPKVRTSKKPAELQAASSALATKQTSECRDTDKSNSGKQGKNTPAISKQVVKGEGRREEMSPTPSQRLDGGVPWKRLCPHHMGQEENVEQALHLNDHEQGQKSARATKGQRQNRKKNNVAQMQQIQQALHNAPILNWLDPQTMKQVADSVEIEHVRQGQTVVFQGHAADGLHVVVAGTFQFFVLTDFGVKFVHVLHGRGSFGEISLLYSVPRQTTCVAATDGTLLALERSDFRSLVVGAARRKWDYHKSFIQSVPLLQALEPHEKLILAGCMKSLSIQDGQCIYSQGDVADGMYFVARGKVKLVTAKQRGGSCDREVYVLPTQHFGTSDVFDSKKRSCSAFADGDSEVCFVRHDCVNSVLSSCYQALKKSATLHCHP